MNSKLQKIHEIITAKIISAIDAGTAPWMRPWDGRCGPSNGITGRMYTGINNMMLSLEGMAIDEGKDPRWLTFQQAKQKCWKVKKGSTGTHVLLWKPLYGEDKEGNAEIKAVWQKTFTVFHASQIDGISEYVPPAMNNIAIQEKAEKIIESSGAVIRFGGNRACYVPALNRIQMPQREFFYSSEGYYSTILHELIHWTKHPDRLARHSDTYAEEELVAEIGSMFMSAATGIPQTEENFGNDVAYVKSWLQGYKDKSAAIFRAAAMANKAVNWLLEKAGEQPAEISTEQE